MKVSQEFEKETRARTCLRQQNQAKLTRTSLEGKPTQWSKRQFNIQ